MKEDIKKIIKTNRSIEELECQWNKEQDFRRKRQIAMWKCCIPEKAMTVVEHPSLMGPFLEKQEDVL